MVSEIYNINDIQNCEFKCLFCNKSFHDTKKLGLHIIDCKEKHVIKNSGLYVMWNKKFVDAEGNIFFKIGRTSSRKKRLSGYSTQYGLSKSGIFFLYEIEVQDEKLAERFLFSLLKEFRIDKKKELFMTTLENIVEHMDFVQECMKGVKNKKNLKKNIILKSYFKEIIQKINNETDQEIMPTSNLEDQIKEDEGVISKIFKCQYCDKILTSKRNLENHEKNICKFKNNCYCEKCNRKFGSLKYLERHKKICVGDLTCPKCNKTLGRKYTYQQHVQKCIK